MAGRKTLDLFLNVSGSTDNLKTAMEAGRIALRSLGAAAGDVQAEVKRAFDDLNKGSIADGAKAIEQSYERSFAKIMQSARNAASMPTPKLALQIIDAGAADSAASAMERSAAALRVNADAAMRCTINATENAQAQRAVAAGFETNALAAERDAVALRAHATVMQNVAAEVGGLAGAQTKGAVATRGSGQAFIQASQQAQDFFIQVQGGQSITTAFLQQGSQMAFVLSNVEGKVGKVASAFAGPWGIAIGIALSVLGPLVSKLFGTGDAADKAKDSTFDFANALDTRKLSVTQFADAVTQLDKATQGLNQSQALLADTLLANAKNGEADARARLADIDGRIAKAEARVNKSGAVSNFIGLSAESMDAKRAGAELVGLRGQRKTIADTIPSLQASASNARIAIIERNAREGLSKTTQLQGQLERDLAALAVRRRASAKQEGNSAAGNIPMGGRVKVSGGYLSEADFTKQENALRRNAQAKIDAAGKAKSNASRAASQFERDNRQNGRTVNATEAAAIVRGIGGQVNSSFRTYAQQAALYNDPKVNRPGNPVARPGTSAHESGNALDVQMTPGMSIAKIRQAFRAEGVSLSKAIVERGHFHVEFGKGRKGASPETLAKREERERVKPFDQQRAFEGELGTARQRLARAQLTLVDTAEERLKVDIEELDAAKLQRDIQIKDAYESGKYGDVGSQIAVARAAQLTAVNASATTAEKQAVSERNRQVELDQKLSIDRAEINDKMALMNAQASLATTAEQRRQIALQLLALEEQQLRDEANRKLGSGDPATRAQGVRDLKQVDALHPYRVEQTKRDTADPLETYGRRINDATSSMSDALKGVKANGFQALEDGLVGLLTGTESVSGAFNKMASSIIADLARIAIEKAIVSALGKSFFGFSEGGPVDIQKHADGGFIRGAGNATSDSILSWLSNGEFVINAASTRRHLPLLKAINDNRLPRFASGGSVGRLAYPALPTSAVLRAPATVTHMFAPDLRGAVMTEDLLRQMQAMAAATGRAAALAGADLAGARASTSATRRLA